MYITLSQYLVYTMVYNGPTLSVKPWKSVKIWWQPICEGNGFLASYKKAVTSPAFTHVLQSKKVEFEYLHAFDLFYMSSFYIDIEYTNGTIL